MAPPAPVPCPDDLGPAVEHARAWLLARIAELLDDGCLNSPALLPEVARVIATTTEAVRDYEKLVERLRPQMGRG